MKCREKKQERHQENKLASYFTQILHLFGAQHYDQEEVLQSSRWYSNIGDDNCIAPSTSKEWGCIIVILDICYPQQQLMTSAVNWIKGIREWGRVQDGPVGCYSPLHVPRTRFLAFTIQQKSGDIQLRLRPKGKTLREGERPTFPSKYFIISSFCQKNKARLVYLCGFSCCFPDLVIRNFVSMEEPDVVVIRRGYRDHLVSH